MAASREDAQSGFWNRRGTMNFELRKEQTFIRKMVREFEINQMNNEEAIKILEGMKKAHEDLYAEYRDEVYSRGSRALNIAIRAVGKEIAKEPVDRIAFKECPTCGHIDIAPGDTRCERCGQALKWGDKR